VFSERHLRHLLLSYMKYYNGARTHLSLEKDAPFSRAVDRAGTFFVDHPGRTASPICPDLIYDRHRNRADQDGLHSRRLVPRIQPWNTGSGAQSPFSTGAVSWQPIHVAAIVA
jgi:hypothetical protein